MNSIKNYFFPLINNNYADSDDKKKDSHSVEDSMVVEKENISSPSKNESKKRKVSEGSEEANKNKRAKVENLAAQAFDYFSGLPPELRLMIFQLVDDASISVCRRISRLSYMETDQWDILRKVNQVQAFKLLLKATLQVGEIDSVYFKQNSINRISDLAMKTGFFQITDSIIEKHPIQDHVYNKLRLMNAQARIENGDMEGARAAITHCRGVLTASDYVKIGAIQLKIKDFSGLENTMRQSENSIELLPIYLTSLIDQGKVTQVQDEYNQIMAIRSRKFAGSQVLLSLVKVFAENNLLDNAKALSNKLLNVDVQFHALLSIAKAGAKKENPNEAMVWFIQAENKLKEFLENSSAYDDEQMDVSFLGKRYHLSIALAENGYEIKSEEIAKRCRTPLDKCLIFMKLADMKSVNDRVGALALLNKSVEAALNLNDATLLYFLITALKGKNYVDSIEVEKFLEKFKEHLVRLKTKANKAEKPIERFHAFCEIAGAQYACGDITSSTKTFQQATTMNVDPSEGTRLKNLKRANNLSKALAKMGKMDESLIQINEIKEPSEKTEALLDVLTIFMISKGLLNPKM